MRHISNTTGRSYRVIGIPDESEIVVPNTWWVALETIHASVPGDVPPGTHDYSPRLSEYCVTIAQGEYPSAVRRNIRSLSLRRDFAGREGGPFTATSMIWHAKNPFAIVVISRSNSFAGKERQVKTSLRFSWPNKVHKGELVRGGITVPEFRDIEARSRENGHSFVALSALADLIEFKPIEIVERYGFLAGIAEGFDGLFIHAENQESLAKGRYEKYVVMSAVARELSAIRKFSKSAQTIDKVWVPLGQARQLVLLYRLGVDSETDLCPWKTYG